MRDHEQPGRTPAVVRDVGEHDSEVYVVGIRESPDPDSWSLLFMTCYDAEDPQEVDLGMDTYCLVVDPGQATHYGGVRECEPHDGRLRLILTEEAATSLGMAVDTSFALDVPPQRIDLPGRGLARVLTSGRADAVPRLQL